MYQHDPSLDDLLRRPMLMAANNDVDDFDDEDEEDDDLFGDDILQAAKQEREDEEREASAFAASLLGQDEEDAPIQEAVAETPQEPSKLFTRPGIRRNLIGYGVLTLLGFVPLVLLFLFSAAAGLSPVMMLFAIALVFGLGLSIYNLVYSFQHGYEFTVSFNIRSFFKLWPEVAVIAAVLFALGFWNLSQLGSGKSFTLSGKPIAASAMSATSTSGDENEEEVVFSSFKLAQANPAGAASQGLPSDLNQLLNGPVVGGAVGAVGGNERVLGLAPAGGEMAQDVVLGTDNPLINTFFLGGPLCAALGYALVLGLAGAIFGGLRRFETPFSQKYVEIINIETGEVTSDRQPIAPVMQAVNVVARVLIGLFYGATLGFVLGTLIVLPLVMFFRQGLLSPLSAPLLQTLGLSNLPDLAFTNAVSLGAILIPLVILVVAKMSPQGMSVSEELMRQHYEIRPTGRFIPADQLVGGNLPPTMINFGAGGIALIPDDELETELAANRLLNELAMDDDNLTSEIIEEFGRDFEKVFGIDTRELISEPRQRQSVDKKRMALALDESFGELGNVPVEISAELGQASLPITEWLNLREGTLVLLDKAADEEIDILFNGVRKGKGKLVVSDDALAVKVSNTYFQNSNGKLI